MVKRGDSGRAPGRDDRLKKALKANLARRKAQAAARGSTPRTPSRKDGQD